MKILLAIVMLLVAIPVSAQNRYEIDGRNIQDRVQELKETINQRTDQYQMHLYEDEEVDMDQNRERDRKTIRIHLKEHRAERVQGLVEKIGNNFNLITERFENIISRFESRLDKFDEDDVDTSETRELLILASNEVDDLKIIISNLNGSLEELLAEEVSVEDIRTEVSNVKDAVHNTRNSIKNALNNFKASVKVDITTTDDDN